MKTVSRTISLPFVFLLALVAQAAIAQGIGIPGVTQPLPSIGGVTPPGPTHILPPPPGTKDCHGVPIPQNANCPNLPVSGPVAPSLCHGIPLPPGLNCPSIPGDLGKILSIPDLGGALVNCVLNPQGCNGEASDSIKARVAAHISQALTDKLNAGITFWETQTRYCLTSTIPPFPGKSNADGVHACDDQDMGLFNGLLCSVGDARGCDAVKRSQDAAGRWWRSPSLVGKDSKHGGAAASMSEEQTWGVFLYLIEKNDKAAFDLWVKWIGEESRPCWIKIGGSCQFSGLPQWCTDTSAAAACNFLPFECVAFERLARHFNEDPATVSRKIGCDLVMGATYGAAGGLLGGLGIAVPLLTNSTALIPALPALAANNTQLKSKLQGLAANPTAPSAFPATFFSSGKKIDVPAALAKASLPSPPAKICIKDLVPFGLPLPPLPPQLSAGPGGCIIPPNIFNPPVFFPPQLGGAFTTGYPVQLQVYGQALVTTVPYAIHKVAVQIWLLQRLGLDDDTLRKATKKVIDSGPKSNAFFAYLGEHGTDHIADMVLKKCPASGGPQAPLRVEWMWEQEEGKSDFSYWDCIFAAKLLVGAQTIDPPSAMRYMQQVQSARVAKPFSEKCNVSLSGNAAAPVASQPAGKDDYIISFQNVSPGDTWDQGKIFLAPCQGTYTFVLKVAQGSSTVQLVSSLRYGQPLLTLIGKKGEQTVVTVFLQPYEAVAAVLPESSSARPFNGATLTVKMVP